MFNKKYLYSFLNLNLLLLYKNNIILNNLDYVDTV